MDTSLATLTTPTCPHPPPLCATYQYITERQPSNEKTGGTETPTEREGRGANACALWKLFSTTAVPFALQLVHNSQGKSIRGTGEGGRTDGHGRARTGTTDTNHSQRVFLASHTTTLSVGWATRAWAAQQLGPDVADMLDAEPPSEPPQPTAAAHVASEAQDPPVATPMPALPARDLLWVHLVGVTPRGLQSSRLGSFRAAEALTNGKRAYVKEGEPDTMLWWAPTIRAWVVGGRSKLGTKTGGVRLTSEELVHGKGAAFALAPEDVVAWEVYDKASGVWVATALRSLSGEQMNARLFAAPEAVHLLGSTPRGMHASRLGRCAFASRCSAPFEIAVARRRDLRRLLATPVVRRRAHGRCPIWGSWTGR